MNRAVGRMLARNSVRNCWSWSVGWRRMTKKAWWHTRFLCCCGIWHRARTSQRTSWIRHLLHISRFWTTAAHKSARRFDAYSHCCSSSCAYFQQVQDNYPWRYFAALIYRIYLICKDKRNTKYSQVQRKRPKQARRKLKFACRLNLTKLNMFLAPYVS